MIAERTLPKLLLRRIESELDAYGYSVRTLLSYLADVNDTERRRLQNAQELDLLMIFGGDDLIGLRKIFARYFDELRHKGLRTIVITGGIGRLTATLLQAVLAEQEHAERPTLSIQKTAETIQVYFELTQNFLGREKVKFIKEPPFDLEASKESLLPYVSEADIYLELFLDEWLNRGGGPEELEIVGYDDYLRNHDNRFRIDRSRAEIVYMFCPGRLEQIAEARRQGKLLILVEGVSTNTGNNTSYSLEMLRSAGYIRNRDEARQRARRTAVYQQPALQLRTKYTVEKQFGALPLSVSYVPDYYSLALQERTALLLLIAGEFKRLLLYSQAPHHFFRRPESFDPRIVDFFQKYSSLLEELSPRIFSLS